MEWNSRSKAVTPNKALALFDPSVVTSSYDRQAAEKAVDAATSAGVQMNKDADSIGGNAVHALPIDASKSRKEREKVYII